MGGVPIYCEEFIEEMKKNPISYFLNNIYELSYYEFSKIQNYAETKKKLHETQEAIQKLIPENLKTKHKELLSAMSDMQSNIKISKQSIPNQNKKEPEGSFLLIDQRSSYIGNQIFIFILEENRTFSTPRFGCAKV